MGRKPIGKKAMTAAERQRARRKRLQDKVSNIKMSIVRYANDDSDQIEITFASDDVEARKELESRVFKQIDRLFKSLSGKPITLMTAKRQKQRKRG